METTMSTLDIHSPAQSLARYPAYKDSGIDWIGEIPEHWEVKRLQYYSRLKSIIGKINEELLSVFLDKGVIKFNEVDTKRTNVTSHDLSKYQLVEQGDLVLNNQQAWRGSVGVSKYRGIVSPAYLVLKLSNEFDSNYANYLFRDASMVTHYLLNSRGVGTIQRNLYWPSLKVVLTIHPPLPEQEAIAEFLDKKCEQIDRLIRIKEQQIERLQELRQAKIHQAVTKGLNPNVPLKDSGIEWIGQIPEHWEVKRFGSFLSPYSQKNMAQLTLLSITREKGVIIRDKENQDENHNYIPDDLSGYKHVKIGQFAMNKMKAWQGSYGISKYEGIVSPAYYVFDVLIDINLDFFNWAIRSSSYISFFGQASDGVRIGQWDLSLSRMKDIRFVIPPLPEQEAIVAYLEQATNKIDQAIAQREAQIEKLKAYKQSLINEVVTGKIKVT